MRLAKMLFCAARAALAPPSSGLQAQTTLRLAHQFAPDSLPGRSAQRVAELVQSKSGGSVRVTVLSGGTLGDERANLQQLGSETIDLALTGDQVISALARPYMIVSMPFLYSSRDHSLAVFNGPIGAETGALFLAGIVPGLLMALALMVAVYICALRGHCPREPRPDIAEIAAAASAALPSLLIPVIVIIGIFTGWFTPTEAAIVSVAVLPFIAPIVLVLFTVVLALDLALGLPRVLCAWRLG